MLRYLALVAATTATAYATVKVLKVAEKVSTDPTVHARLRGVAMLAAARIRASFPQKKLAAAA